MFCAVKGCDGIATHQIVIVMKDGRRVYFNVCKKHSKVNWKIRSDKRKREKNI